MYRLLTHERVTISPDEFETRMSFEDVERMHRVLNALDAAEAKAQPD